MGTVGFDSLKLSARCNQARANVRALPCGLRAKVTRVGPEAELVIMAEGSLPRALTDSNRHVLPSSELANALALVLDEMTEMADLTETPRLTKIETTQDFDAEPGDISEFFDALEPLSWPKGYDLERYEPEGNLAIANGSTLRMSLYDKALQSGMYDWPGDALRVEAQHRRARLRDKNVTLEVLAAEPDRIVHELHDDAIKRLLLNLAVVPVDDWLDRLYALPLGTELLKHVAEFVLAGDVKVDKHTVAKYMRVLRSVGARPAEIRRGFSLDSEHGLLLTSTRDELSILDA